MTWKQGTIVEDQGGSMQIVLFVDNNDTFKCINTKGEINTFSVHCHKFRANNLNEYLSKPINNAIDYINGEAKTFSSRTKEAVLYQLKKLKQ